MSSFLKINFWNNFVWSFERASPTRSPLITSTVYRLRTRVAKLVLWYELYEYIPSLYLFYSLVRIPIDQGPILFYWLVELERYAILLLVQNFVLCYCYPKCLVVPLLNAVPVKIFYDLLKGSRVSKSCISLRLVSYGNAMIWWFSRSHSAFQFSGLGTTWMSCFSTKSSVRSSWKIQYFPSLPYEQKYCTMEIKRFEVILSRSSY